MVDIENFTRCPGILKPLVFVSCKNALFFKFVENRQFFQIVTNIREEDLCKN